MEKLRLYTVDSDYIKYLYQFDNHVMHWSNNDYKTERKYLGIVLTVNGFKYFAPLSSPKENDYYYKNGLKLIKKNTVQIVRLVTEKNVLLGKIKLANMIPVEDNYITLYDIDAEKDIKYKELIKDEVICVRKLKKEICRNAQILYNQKINKYDNISYLDSTIDFRILEEACIKYGLKEDKK